MSFCSFPLFDGLVEGCSNSIASALELLQSCAKPSDYDHMLLYMLMFTWSDKYANLHTTMGYYVNFLMMRCYGITKFYYAPHELIRGYGANLQTVIWRMFLSCDNNIQRRDRVNGSTHNGSFPERMEHAPERIISQDVEILLMDDSNKFIILGQCHGCWCHGSLRRHVISSYDIDQFIPEYSSLSPRKVTLFMPPASTKLKGGILVSPCPSLRLWTESCPLCIFNNTCGILFIFIHLMKQLPEVCRV